MCRNGVRGTGQSNRFGKPASAGHSPSRPTGAAKRTTALRAAGRQPDASPRRAAFTSACTNSKSTAERTAQRTAQPSPHRPAATPIGSTRPHDHHPEFRVQPGNGQRQIRRPSALCQLRRGGTYGAGRGWRIRYGRYPSRRRTNRDAHDSRNHRVPVLLPRKHAGYHRRCLTWRPRPRTARQATTRSGPARAVARWLADSPARTVDFGNACSPLQPIHRSSRDPSNHNASRTIPCDSEPCWAGTPEGAAENTSMRTTAAQVGVSTHKSSEKVIRSWNPFDVQGSGNSRNRHAKNQQHSSEHGGAQIRRPYLMGRTSLGLARRGFLPSMEVERKKADAEPIERGSRGERKCLIARRLARIQDPVRRASAPLCIARKTTPVLVGTHHRTAPHIQLDMFSFMEPVRL